MSNIHSIDISCTCPSCRKTFPVTISVKPDGFEGVSSVYMIEKAHPKVSGVKLSNGVIQATVYCPQCDEKCVIECR